MQLIRLFVACHLYLGMQFFDLMSIRISYIPYLFLHIESIELPEQRA